ncbi:MAG TPA: SufE family protein [Gemmatimonadales bacterium]|jgi:cysteine desulfuration protein SufE|nr:SufE family protein [Gemmatimonadales bacterium]
MTGLENIIKRFQGADRDTRLELLLDFANRLPPLPEKYREAVAQGVNRVHECQTPVYLFMEPVNGSVEIHADVPREAPTVRGFLSLLIKGLKGATPDEVVALPGDLLDRLQLSELLGMTRMQGLSAVVQRIKGMAKNVSSKQ